MRQCVISGAVVLGRGRHDEQVAAVARQQLGSLLRAERLQQLCPPELRLEDAHQDVPSLEDREAVPRLPPVRDASSTSASSAGSGPVSMKALTPAA